MYLSILTAHEIHHPHEIPCSRLQDSTSQIDALSMPSPCCTMFSPCFFQKNVSSISLAPAHPSNSIQASPSQQSSVASHWVNAAHVTLGWFTVDCLCPLQDNPSSRSLLRLRKCLLRQPESKESGATPLTTYHQATLKPWAFIFIYTTKHLPQTLFSQPPDSTVLTME